MTETLHTFALRFLQVFESAGPTLLVGILAAAALRSMVAPESIRRFFDAGRRGGTFRALLVAAMLPVGSLGVLPIAFELHRAKVAAPAVLVFAVAAPLLNPLAFAQALTSLDGATILWTFGTAAAVCLAVSFLVPRVPVVDGTVAGIAPSALVRMMDFLIAAARVSSGVLVFYVLLAAIASGMAATCVDGHALIHVLSPRNPLAATVMTAVALPAYVSPPGGITLMHGMAAMQLSVGAGIAAYVFGVGQNIGLLFWIGKTIGPARFAVLLLTAVGLVFGAGIAADAQFRGRSTVPSHAGHGHHHEPDHSHEHGHEGCGCGGEEHNHALDVLGRWETAVYRNPFIEAFRFSKPSQVAAAVFLAALCGAGIVLRCIGVDLHGLPDAAEESAASDVRGVSSRGVVVIGLLYFAGIAVLGLYVYYPPTGELFTQMTFHRANAILATKHNKCDYAVRELDAWDALAAKSATSATLRGAPPSDEARRAVQDLRCALAALRKAVVEGQSDEDKKTLSHEVMEAYSRCRTAFAPE